MRSQRFTPRFWNMAGERLGLVVRMLYVGLLECFMLCTFKNCVFFFLILLENQFFTFTPVRFQAYFTCPVPLWTLYYICGQCGIVPPMGTHFLTLPLYWIMFMECTYSLLLKNGLCNDSNTIVEYFYIKTALYIFCGWCFIALPTLLNFKMQRELNVG